MKIPESVRIGGVEYAVEYLPDINDGEHVCYGKIDYENNLNGIREHAGIEIANEEAVVDMFAKGIYQVLQDNGKRLFDIAEKSDEPSIDGSAIPCETLNHISTEVKKSCP